MMTLGAGPDVRVALPVLRSSKNSFMIFLPVTAEIVCAVAAGDGRYTTVWYRLVVAKEDTFLECKAILKNSVFHSSRSLAFVKNLRKDSRDLTYRRGRLQGTCY